MLNVVVTGNLASSVEPSKNPDWLKVRVGSNSTKRNRDGGYDKVTTWCSGVVNANQVKGIRDRLVKGAYVVASVSDCHIDTYQSRDGETRASLALGIIRILEVGKSPVDGASSAPKADNAVADYSQPQHGSPNQQSQYQQQQQPQQQQPSPYSALPY